ncbi:MAG: hypothetical protein AAFV80_16530, partial [Bacteroidota bacterium]
GAFIVDESDLGSKENFLGMLLFLLGILVVVYLIDLRIKRATHGRKAARLYLRLRLIVVTLLFGFIAPAFSFVFQLGFYGALIIVPLYFLAIGHFTKTYVRYHDLPQVTT